MHYKMVDVPTHKRKGMVVKGHKRRRKVSAIVIPNIPGQKKRIPGISEKPNGEGYSGLSTYTDTNSI